MPLNQMKRLLVEGVTDLCAVAEIMEANGIAWTAGSEPVDIKVLGTKTPPKSDVTAELKVDANSTVGIILDADDDLLGTWTTIRKWLLTQVREIPLEISDAGFISESDEQHRRFGAWIMPNNQSKGTLETLLKQLVRPESKAILDHAIHACDGAKALNAPFRDVHAEKAHVFTWLAWQDEPGRNLRSVDFQAVFDAQSNHAQPFVKWFRNLFDV